MNARYQRILINRQRFDQVRAEIKLDNNDENAEKVHPVSGVVGNKFVTELTVRENEDGTKYAECGFGVRFYYHSYYKHNTKEGGEMLPGSGGMPEYGNDDYRYCDWFIAAKYESLKQEVTLRRDGYLNKHEFETVSKKASWKYRELGRRIKCSTNYWSVVYGIKKGDAVSEQHILALFCYTDYGELCAAFRNTYRKLNEEESDESLKKRQSEYANMGKLLRELVGCFGTWFPLEKKTKQFYHGLSSKMLFAGFDRRFYGPTSTSLREEIAVSFAEKGSGGNGVVITIKKICLRPPFFIA